MVAPGNQAGAQEAGEEAMSQQDRILAHLMRGRPLTRLNSWDELGVIEAPARISELRSKGHAIETTMKTVTNRYGEKVRIAVWSL